MVCALSLACVALVEAALPPWCRADDGPKPDVVTALVPPGPMGGGQGTRSSRVTVYQARGSCKMYELVRPPSFQT